MENFDESNEQAPKRGRGGYQRGRSRKGCPNRTTQMAREVVTKFVEGNIPKLQAWLDQVAEGVWCEKSEKWLVRPDPQAAFQMVQSLLEFHVPKLQRVDMSVSGSVQVKTFNIVRVASNDGQPSVSAPIHGQESM